MLDGELNEARMSERNCELPEPGGWAGAGEGGRAGVRAVVVGEFRRDVGRRVERGEDVVAQLRLDRLEALRGAGLRGERGQPLGRGGGGGRGAGGAAAAA